MGSARHPHGRAGSKCGVLTAEHRRGLAQLHSAWIAGRGVTLDLIAGANRPGREHRGTLSQLHPALVASRHVIVHLVAAANGPQRAANISHLEFSSLGMSL